MDECYKLGIFRTYPKRCKLKVMHFILIHESWGANRSYQYEICASCRLMSNSHHSPLCFQSSKCRLIEPQRDIQALLPAACTWYKSFEHNLTFVSLAISIRSELLHEH